MENIFDCLLSLSSTLYVNLVYPLEPYLFPPLPTPMPKFLCPVDFTTLTISGLQVEIQVSAQIVGQQRHPVVMSAEQEGGSGHHHRYQSRFQEGAGGVSNERCYREDS